MTLFSDDINLVTDTVACPFPRNNNARLLYGICEKKDVADAMHVTIEENPTEHSMGNNLFSSYQNETVCGKSGWTSYRYYFSNLNHVISRLIHFLKFKLTLVISYLYIIQ